jgi:hypothetical protein
MPPYAPLDRAVAEHTDSVTGGRPGKISDLANEAKFVLLGEPGSGKSTAFAQAAAQAGVQTVTAREFVEGARPEGRVVFIDALEEYRLGEPLRERLSDLANALKDASYTHWRIACRSISLPPAEVRFLTQKLGDFSVWVLRPLDWFQIRAILGHLGEADPSGFMVRVDAMAAGSLMENPATLKLLHQIVLTGKAISTRGALLAEAVRQMAHEVNPDLPDDKDRPPSERVVAAAETASLVLLLSGRLGVWSSSRPAVGDHLVTPGDLLEAKIDTLALRYALDTPLFVGEGGVFSPAHRIVTEYLAGNALARATDPPDGRAGLPIERVLALLGCSEGRPAPGLAGAYAWFVSALSKTQHVRRAFDLVQQDPESIVFQGDPAMLPTPHRLALLDAVGREDPWFLSNVRGATAIGGLAGDDLAEALITMILDVDEVGQRRAMALEALAVGRPVPAVRDRLLAFAANPITPQWLRRHAIKALANGDPNPAVFRRGLLDALATEDEGGALELRIILVGKLIGHGATVDEVRQILLDYGVSGEEVIGYLSPVIEALRASPMLGLFDQPFPPPQEHTTRGSELARALERALVATIAANPTASASDLLRWVLNLGRPRHTNVGDDLAAAIGIWLAAAPDRPLALFDALLASFSPDDRWDAGYAYTRLVHREVPYEVRAELIARLEAAIDAQADQTALQDLGEVAARLARPTSSHPQLTERVMVVLTANRPLFASTLAWMESTALEDYAQQQAAFEAERATQSADQQSRDRVDFAANADLIRSGTHQNGLIYAAELALGYHGERESDATPTEDRLTDWFGPDVARDIRVGWEALARAYPISAQQQGEVAGRSAAYSLDIAAVVYVLEGINRGDLPDLSPEIAIGALRAFYAVKDEAGQKRVKGRALERLLRDEGGREAVWTWWTGALEGTAPDIPRLSELARGGEGFDVLLERLLRAWPSLPPNMLHAALSLAMKRFEPDRLRELAITSLSLMLPLDSHRAWTIVKFCLDPEAEARMFERCVVDEEGHNTLASYLAAALDQGLTRNADEALSRDRIIVERLGPIYPPRDGFEAREGLQQLVAAGIHRIAGSPLAQAGRLLERLRDRPALAAWNSVIRNQAAAQDARRREAQFIAPEPGDVASALAGGPPATPADLRAVLRQVLADLKRDIKTGPTAPWRGFWNRPFKAADRTPKVENECRDLLTDRLIDRLTPFRIPVEPPTEHRSVSDRRVDLVVIGAGEAAVPIEAKRHYNTELWTAVVDQLVPYSDSLRAGGHGVYLIFWFGMGFRVPTTPEGLGPVGSAETLQAALVAHLPSDLKSKIDVVVIDVEHQETASEKAARERKEREAADAKAGKAPRPPRKRKDGKV